MPSLRSYNPSFFEKLIEIEEQHFWFYARNRVIAAALQQIIPQFSPEYRVLEVGCGTGNVLRILHQNCPDGIVVGMDLFAEGLSYGRKRTTCPLVQGDMHFPPFRKAFHLIGIFDVLEHLPDDRQVLQDLYAMLTREGRLLLTVPAHPSLWSYFDEASCHVRRYCPDELHEKLSSCGYTVEYLTQYMMLTFPFIWIGRRLASVFNRHNPVDSKQADILAINELCIIPGLNWGLKTILVNEAAWIARRWKLPLGTSLIAIARKSSPDS